MIGGEVRINHVLPLMPDIINEWEAIKKGGKRQPDHILWGEIQRREPIWSSGEFEIEPGESDNKFFEFFVPSGHEVIDVSTWFINEQKSKSDHALGWGASTLFDLRNPGECL